MKKVGGYIATAFAVKEVTNFGKNAVKTASEIQSAWTGLNSIVQGTGKSFNTAQEFINKYTEDGLVSVTEAVTSYKNLLSRGYDTSQIEGTMNALKDSASFGRQASYDLGEAVVTATEGLKNENSILVDNAGVTKNVAKMWDEYASSIGKTSNNLTQAEKIQAEYKGILEETRFQTGDAITYASTFSGQIQRLKASFTSLKVAVGKVITPIAQLFIPVINSAVNAITNLFNGISKVMSAFGFKFQEVVGKNTSSVANFTKGVTESGDATVKSAKKAAKANKSFSNVDEINVISSNKSSDNGSVGNSSGGGGISQVEIVPKVANDNAVSSAIDATVLKIQKFIEPLKNISFDNLINAFGNLWEAIKPFGQTIGSGLEWLYFNVLVPLAQWTIEGVIPGFLNILAGALSVVNQALSDIQPIFDWFWETILKPLAEWTGGIIVDTLNGIGDALKWLSDNEIAMTLIESLGIAIGVVAGALAIYNVVMAACNVVTGIFTGIMGILTSPITLVILVITALVAIIITCVKHWETIKEVVSNVVAVIKEKVTNVFNNIKTVIGNVMNTIKSVISTIWNGIKSIISSVVSTISEFISSAFNGIKNIISSVMNVIKSVISNVWNGIWGLIKGVINSILGGVESMVNGVIKGANMMSRALNKLSFDVPDWVPVIGGKKFGFNLKEITEVSLPRLYQGGYVDKNNPQLAIIGDNTREGEIVTPESKIYEQVDKAIKNNGGNTSQELHIVLEVRYEDGKTIIKKINQEQIDAGEILLLT